MLFSWTKGKLLFSIFEPVNTFLLLLLYWKIQWKNTVDCCTRNSTWLQRWPQIRKTGVDSGMILRFCRTRRAQKLCKTGPDPESLSILGSSRSLHGLYKLHCLSINKRWKDIGFSNPSPTQEFHFKIQSKSCKLSVSNSKSYSNPKSYQSCSDVGKIAPAQRLPHEAKWALSKKYLGNKLNLLMFCLWLTTLKQ